MTTYFIILILSVSHNSEYGGLNLLTCSQLILRHEKKTNYSIEMSLSMTKYLKIELDLWFFLFVSYFTRHDMFGLAYSFIHYTSFVNTKYFIYVYFRCKLTNNISDTIEMYQIFSLFSHAIYVCLLQQNTLTITYDIMRNENNIRKHKWYLKFIRLTLIFAYKYFIF